jgi:uncharacterized protein (DUF849 family)
MTFADPVLLAVAPNGAYKQKADHPAVPLTAAELAAEARRCLDAGAAMIHLHVRTPEGRHLLDAEAYRDATRAIRAAVGPALVVQVTTESGRVYAPPQQMAVVRELVPEAVSVAVRELIPDASHEAEAAAFFAWLAEAGILTQLILYDADDLRRWHALRARGVIPDARWSLLFVLGRYSAGQRSEPADLLPFLAAHAGPEPWAVCAFGPQENACMMAAAAFGGHLRVGFENNLLLPDGRVADDNAALVRRAADGVRGMGRTLADAAQVRRQFG